MSGRLMVLTLSLAPLLGGCASTGGLEREIASIETRVQSVEREITEATADIGGAGKDIRARMRYRPLVSWAESFSARPGDQRTIEFRQTSRDGDVYEVEHECRFTIPGGWRRRDGKRAWVHEANSTKVDLEIGRFAIDPTEQGLDLRTDLKIDGRTQVAGNYRVACGPSVGGNIGITATARPSILTRVTFIEGPDALPRYRIALVSPDRIGLEMRGHFQWFTVGFTIPFEKLAREIAQSELNLLFAKDGEIVLPDGPTRTYRLATIEPGVATSTEGMMFETDLVVEVEQPR